MLSGPTSRRYKDKLVFSLSLFCVALALIPLASILVEVVRNGVPALSTGFLTSAPAVIGPSGIGTAIQGTFILIGLTCLIGIPIGVLAGVYLAEFGDHKVGRTIRFLNDVLTQFPSIVIGILGYSLIVVFIGRFSTVAGAIALGIIMLPVITRTTEESVKLVPTTIRDAAMALGVRRWRTTVSVVLTTAKRGVVNGIMLAIARITGETAPLILTVLGSDFFFSGLDQPVDALPLRIWKSTLLLADPASHQQGWGAALVLIIIVLGLNVLARIAVRGYKPLRFRA